jgi:hypothetical protein
MMNRIADILDQMNNRIGALEIDEEGGNWQDRQQCEEMIQELRTANENDAAQEPAPEAKKE